MSVRRDEPTKLPASLSVVAGVENSGARHAEQFFRPGFSPNMSYLCSIAHLQLKFNSVLFSFFLFNSCYVAAQHSWPVAGRAPRDSVQSLWQLLEDTLRKCELRHWGHPFPMLLIQPSRLLTKWTNLSTLVLFSRGFLVFGKNPQRTVIISWKYWSDCSAIRRSSRKIKSRNCHVVTFWAYMLALYLLTCPDIQQGATLTGSSLTHLVSCIVFKIMTLVINILLNIYASLDATHLHKH